MDFGFKRIGIAVAESDLGVITARPTILASGKLAVDAQKLVEMARLEEVDDIVVGLPLEEGEEGRMARICRTLAGHIAEGGFRVHLVDETLTSVEADGRLMTAEHLGLSVEDEASKVRAGRKRDRSQARDDRRGRFLTAAQRKRLKDGEAARLILERYLGEQERGRREEEGGSPI